MTWKDKPILIGSWINSASPIVAEIMSAAQFDFLCVDAEHSPVSIEGVHRLVQAIRAGNPGCRAFVRMPGNAYDETKRYLDMGVSGVIAPLVNTAAEAERLVRSSKYPPQGDRGVGYCPSNGYGFDFDRYMVSANEETMIVVQIEHIKGVENIDSILSVDGIDAVFIGPYDLSASMGITAQFQHPDYTDAIAHILERCTFHGVRPGLHVVQPDVDQVMERVREGFSLIAYSLDITMLGVACRDGLNSIREGLKQ